MNPQRVDMIVDLAYGILIFLALVLMVSVGTNVGVAFGVGALVSYMIHVGWKMARFDPEWMTREVAENIEETITEEVGETVSQEVTDNVEKKVAEQVAENVEETVSQEMDSIDEKLDEVNERIDRRPKADGTVENPDAEDRSADGT